MKYTDLDPEYLEGKKVTVRGISAGEEIEVEGRVDAANDAALLVRGKGRGRLFSAENVHDIELEDTTLKQTEVAPVTMNSVRRHLVNAHGWKLSAVNEIDEGEALSVHEELHREDPEDIGHVHVAKSKKKDK